MIHIVSTGSFTAGDAALASSIASVAGGYDWASAAIEAEPVRWNGESWSDLSTFEIRSEGLCEKFEALEKRVADLEELVKTIWQAKSVGDLL